MGQIFSNTSVISEQPEELELDEFGPLLDWDDLVQDMHNLFNDHGKIVMLVCE